MKSVTSQKSFEEIQQLLKDFKTIYIIGCGTCTTQCRTGGKEEVLAMKKQLESIGKKVSGWMVIPTACDDLTKYALEKESASIKDAEALLVMSCAFGVQTVCQHTRRAVLPGLDTLFIGKENEEGALVELCKQCGQCVLGETAGICPVTTCHKGLLHGPCGGMDRGKCEIDREKDCAWVLIYNRLKEQGRLGVLEKIHPPKNHHRVVGPGKMKIPAQDYRTD